MKRVRERRSTTIGRGTRQAKQTNKEEAVEAENQRWGGSIPAPSVHPK